MAFPQGVTGLSHLPQCFESIFGVTVELVQGNPVYLEWIEISGSFCIVARPLKFLSRFKLRPPPLEVQQEHQDSFPNEAGKWTPNDPFEAQEGRWDFSQDTAVEKGLISH